MMKKFLIAAVCAVAAGSAWADTTIKASVNGMVCAFCAQGIDKNLRATGDTKDVYINLKKKIVAVELKPNAGLTIEKFSALVKESGYDVTKVEMVKESAESIRKANKS
jgi:periplasmic mercuric ion binding protein